MEGSSIQMFEYLYLFFSFSNFLPKKLIELEKIIYVMNKIVEC